MSTTLNLSQLRNWATVGAGQHSLQIKAKAVGYNESPFSSSASFQIVEPPYITFQSEYPFILQLWFASGMGQQWDGTIEFSTDTITWSVVTANTEMTAVQVTQGGNYFLYLRGTGNTYLWQTANPGTGLFSLASFFALKKVPDTSPPSGFPIACTGNIENLLDYQLVQQGIHPTLSSCGLAIAFNQYANNVAGKFTELPRFPFTTLPNYCYAGFCTGQRLKGLPSVIVPSVVPNFAFYKAFTSTTFSDARVDWDLTHVTSIGDNAFSDFSNNFTPEIYLSTNLTSLSATAFQGLAGTKMSIHYLFTDNDTPQFDVNNVIGANTGKTAAAFKIYTDNTAIKDAALAKVDSKNTVNVYHLDGEEWL